MGRRLNENLFIVRYCIDTFRLGKRLIVVVIDLEKAFDSVDRVALIYYKYDPTLKKKLGRIDFCVESSRIKYLKT